MQAVERMAKLEHPSSATSRADPSHDTPRLKHAQNTLSTGAERPSSSISSTAYRSNFMKISFPITIRTGRDLITMAKHRGISGELFPRCHACSLGISNSK